MQTEHSQDDANDAACQGIYIHIHAQRISQDAARFSARHNPLRIFLQIWFFFASASGVFLLPYLNLYLMNVCGYSGAQIGLLSVLRPWASSVASAIGPAMADRLCCHRYQASEVATYLFKPILKQPPFINLCDTWAAGRCFSCPSYCQWVCAQSSP